MKMIAATCVSLVLTIQMAYAQFDKRDNGFVPDAETAIAIAVAVCNPIYGKDDIERQKPYHATLSNGVWTVVGSLPPNMVGGVAIIKISKDDGRILHIKHGR